jgi:RNA-binding protein
MNEDKEIKVDMGGNTYRQLRERSKSLDAIIRIGKNGINDNVIQEIENLLRKRRLIKIKVLKNCLENNKMDSMIETIHVRCKCLVVDRIGMTFSIYR